MLFMIKKTLYNIDVQKKKTIYVSIKMKQYIYPKLPNHFTFGKISDAELTRGKNLLKLSDSELAV